MTRRGAAILFAALGTWAFGRLLGVQELYAVAAASGAVLVAALLSVAMAGSSVVARRRLQARRLPAGGRTRVVIDLRSKSRLPVPALLVEDALDERLAADLRGGVARFVVPGLSRGASVRVTYPLVGRLRGRYAVGPLSIRIRDPFGLVERVRRYAATDEVVVYPQVTPLPGAVSLGRHSGGGHSRTRRLLDAGDEFHTMREYVDGDDMRQVHWPSTARRERLMVRQHEQSFDTEATVLCDTRSAVHHGSGEHASLERAVSAAASVVVHLDALGYRLRLTTEGDPGLPAHAPRDACLDRLAELRPTVARSLTPLLRQIRTAEAGGLLVVVLAAPGTSAALREEHHGLLTALLQAGGGYGARVAVVLDTGAPGSDDQAHRTVALLAAGGWRAAVSQPGADLAQVWAQAVQSARRRAAARVTAPGGAA